MNIDEILAGRELDALVAEKVMGHVVNQLQPNEKDPFGGAEFGSDREWGYPGDWWDADTQRVVASYSTDIAAAWFVVEKVIEEVAPIYQIQSGEELGTHRCIFYVPIPGAGDDDPAWRPIRSDASTAPLAICWAALKAVAVAEA